MAHELGRPYGPGLRRLGLDPAALILAEPARRADALWAAEEGLRSGALAAVTGPLDLPGEREARRLVLAARSSQTPCLLLTTHSRPGVQAAHTRWRIAAERGPPHPFLLEAPGAACWRLVLERCREGPGGGEWRVELCDATHAFHLVARVADRPDAPRRAGARAG
jgi:protein ImuA